MVPSLQKEKNVWELKLKNRDDYFNSQLSSRLSFLLQTCTVHLPHVKHAQRLCRTIPGWHLCFHLRTWATRFTLLSWQNITLTPSTLIWFLKSKPVLNHVRNISTRMVLDLIHPPSRWSGSTIYCWAVTEKQPRTRHNFLMLMGNIRMDDDTATDTQQPNTAGQRRVATAGGRVREQTAKRENGNQNLLDLIYPL